MDRFPRLAPTRLPVKEDYKQSRCTACGNLCYFDWMNGVTLVMLDHVHKKLYRQHQCPNGNVPTWLGVLKAIVLGVFNRIRYGAE